MVIDFEFDSSSTSKPPVCWPLLVGYGVRSSALLQASLARSEPLRRHQDGVYALQKKLTESAEIPDSTEMHGGYSLRCSSPASRCGWKCLQGRRRPSGLWRSTASRWPGKIDGRSPSGG